MWKEHILIKHMKIHEKTKNQVWGIKTSVNVSFIKKQRLYIGVNMIQLYAIYNSSQHSFFKESGRIRNEQ